MVNIQLVVEQNVHSVHCASFYIRTSKKLNKYYFKVPDLHTQSWIPPETLPPTATQNHHDEHLKSKPCATKTNNPNQPKDPPQLVINPTASNIPKIIHKNKIPKKLQQKITKMRTATTTPKQRSPPTMTKTRHTTAASSMPPSPPSPTIDLRLNAPLIFAPKNQLRSLIQLKLTRKYSKQ